MRTLHSIDGQTLPPARVIIVDNNSTDNSLSVISSWADGKDYVTLLSETTPGACAARNRGLSEVTTEWTMFFDSDDVMHPTHISDFTAAIAKHPGADILGRDIFTRFIDGSSRRLYFHGGDNAMFHHLFRGCLSTQRFVARTQLLRTVGTWDESLKGWNDFELGVRLLLHTRNIIDIGGTPSVTTYQQAESITGTSFSAHPERWEESLHTIRGRFLSLPDSDKNKRRYLDWLDARSMILAAQYELESRSKNRDESFAAKAHQLATRLHDEIMARTPSPRRQRLIYLHNLHFHRLTWLLANTLL